MEPMTKVQATVELARAGQSPWLDYISRTMLRSGELEALIREKGILGVTSNPSIFQNAISQPDGGYDEDIRRFSRQQMSLFEIYDHLTQDDIRATCDLFTPIFEKSNGTDGFVSLEVMPNLAYDERATVQEAIRLFDAIQRPNLMIKVPSTPQGIAAFRTLTAKGINVNVTLIFSPDQYREAALAYLRGLEDYSGQGGELNRVHSVASVFVSRFDTMVDAKIGEILKKPVKKDKKLILEHLKGKAAVANSKIIYQEFKKIFTSDRFLQLQKKGAHIQRALWGSTSSKNPQYSDLIYVDTLVGKHTVNTMPKSTLDALLDHGVIRPDSVEENREEAFEVKKVLQTWGIDLDQVGQVLQHKGVKAFSDSFDSLMATLEKVREETLDAKQKKVKIARAVYSFGRDITSEPVNRELKKMKAQQFHQRFLQGDPSLWKQDSKHQAVIRNRFGWFRVHEWMQGKLYELDLLSEQVKKEKIRNILLLGMGGSSLAPEVMSLICDRPNRSPRFYVVDSTDPGTILKVESKVDLKASLIIVASKSGSTIETISQFKYFYQKVTEKYGDESDLETVGKHFVAITDEGSSLERMAREKRFRKIFVNPSDIGGRYSALSFFGLVPAALMGIHVRQILASVRDIFRVTLRESRLQENPGIYLGAMLGILARKGCDKLTFWTSKSLASFGTWLEQLIAESTGKEGKGIVPVEGEGMQDFSVYGPDRVFVVLKLKSDKQPDKWRKQIRTIKKMGFPVIEITWDTRAMIGCEFLRWEIATAVASAVMEINPFDEPNVKESKDITGRLIEELKQTGRLDAPKTHGSVRAKIPFEKIFSKMKKNPYIALLAYTERSPEIQKSLSRIRKRLIDRFGLPVLAGFGPRYLHSIGQLYKGGTKNGVFIQFLMQDTRDPKIPDAGIRFGQLKRAQAYGDAAAISSKGLPLLGIELGKDVLAGLSLFESKLSDYLEAGE
ncbi:MAG: bifunctional transaldolase/phosoglucose isomerase [Candidatus Omnitrophica bacterium]|nr:bifunctional transaldolase/phosoglucose isomerase [Candidatus Omnitrophota bacterium]